MVATFQEADDAADSDLGDLAKRLAAVDLLTRRLGKPGDDDGDTLHWGERPGGLKSESHAPCELRALLDGAEAQAHLSCLSSNCRCRGRGLAGTAGRKRTRGCCGRRPSGRSRRRATRTRRRCPATRGPRVGEDERIDRTNFFAKRATPAVLGSVGRAVDVERPPGSDITHKRGGGQGSSPRKVGAPADQGVMLRVQLHRVSHGAQPRMEMLRHHQPPARRRPRRQETTAPCTKVTSLLDSCRMPMRHQDQAAMADAVRTGRTTIAQAGNKRA
mmetsp:Transcript_22726/g.73441  ORF Transcript_22726/g.73441 Transcript_22726/m.73441 type:complete len:273 (-) Transcript_22726:62-880(-)